MAKSLTLHFTLPHDPTSPIFQLRDARDPVVFDKIGRAEGGNFGHLPFYSVDRNEFHDVNQWLWLDGWEDWLVSIQPETDLNERNWLINPDRPDAHNGVRPYYYKDNRFVFGHCVSPSQPIRIKMSDGKPAVRYFDRVRFNDVVRDNVPMVQVDGFTPEMKEKPVQWLLDNAYFQHWTTITPEGKVRILPLVNPVWSPQHFAGNAGDKWIPLLYLKGYGV